MRGGPTDRRRRWVATAALLALPLAACGGDDDAEPAAEPASEPADEPAAEPAEEPADDGADGDFGFGTGIARVTIGERTYEFDLTSGFSVCRDVFGGLQIGGQTSDGSANIDMWIPPTDWETYTDGRYDPPAITLEDDTLNTRWIADPNRVELLPDWPAESQVDSYDKDGNAAAGAATFVDDYALDAPTPISGTFEVACDG